VLTLGRIIAALLSGALLAQSYGLHPFWPLAWIAPIPLLIAVIGASRLGAFLYGALAGAASTALLITYILRLGAPVVVIVLMSALMWGALTFATRAGARRLPAAAAVFVFPALLAGLETILAAVSPHGAAQSLAYSQMNFAPAIQVAALGGAPAISFVLALFASAVAILLTQRAFVAALAPALIVAGALVFGFTRIPQTPPQPDLRVAMIASDAFDDESADWRPAFEAYATETERVAREGARIIVLPEKIATIPDGAAADALAPYAAIASEYNAVIVLGAVALEGERRFNRAYYVTADGVRTYDKRHMIPGFESDLTVGTADLIADAAGARIGVAICKDFDFPALSRRYGHHGAAIMLAPAWDFDADWWAHSRIGMLRSVESGFTMIRSAKNGVMTVNDAYGRVLAEAHSGDMAVLTAAIPNSPRIDTLYVRIGDAFGWFCVALAALLMGWTILARRRAGQGA
jgi:apolipoprotein N-acyltransferase